MENIKQRKKAKEQEEYDLSSAEENESSSESDNDAFVISKKKPTKKILKPRVWDRTFDDDSDNWKSELDEVRNIVTDMALMQKKQHKATRKQTNRSNGGKEMVKSFHTHG